jgi:hypothetical protein
MESLRGCSEPGEQRFDDMASGASGKVPVHQWTNPFYDVERHGPPMDCPISPLQLTRSTSEPRLFTSSKDPVQQWTTPFHVVNWGSPLVDWNFYGKGMSHSNAR